MDSHATRTPTPDGFVESATVTHEGRSFTSGGAAASDGHLICYPSKPTCSLDYRGYTTRTGTVSTWSGERIGTYRVTGYAHGFGPVWPGTDLTCYRVRLDDGREYVGRGLGSGMILKCRRAAQGKER